MSKQRSNRRQGKWPDPGAPETSRRDAGRGAGYGPGYGYGYAYGDGYGAPLALDRARQTSQLLAALHRYKLALRRHWWIPVLALALALAPTSYYIYTQPPSFQSTGTLWVSGKLNLQQGQLYSEVLSDFMQTQVELLQSSVIQHRALTNILAASSDSATGLNCPSNGQDLAITLNVAVRPKTAMINLTAKGPYPDPTRRFVNAVMEEYQAFRKEMRARSTDSTLSSASEQVKQLELDLKVRQEALQQFLASNNVVMLQQQGSSAGGFAAKLNNQLESLRMELNLLQLMTPEQLSQAGVRDRSYAADQAPLGENSAHEFLLSMAGPQADYFRAMQQIELLKGRRAKLARYLRPIHPKIVKMDRDIASQEDIVRVFKDQSVDQMANRRQALELQIKSLETAAADWEAKALDANQKMAEYENMRQELQRKQGLYQQLLTVVQSVDLNRTLDQEIMQPLEAASPAKPVRQHAKFLALGSAVGLLVGLSLLYFLTLFDDRFASIAELRSQLAEVVVGAVPEVPMSSKHPTLELVRNEEDRHVFAESFRNIRSWILFSFPKKDRPRTLLVTSAVPLEGKTTVAANLAVTLALAGSKVLLVDGDLRRAGLDTIFGVTTKSGLADVLGQTASYADALVPTNIANLWLLPAGTVSTNPGELFLAPSCDIFLSRIHKQYDYILFDTAPVLASDDTSNLSPKVDGVLFVARADFTSARLARESLELLRQRKAEILGLVFNRASAARSQGGYYYRYSDYYYRGYGRGSGRQTGKDKSKGDQEAQGEERDNSSPPNQEEAGEKAAGVVATAPAPTASAPADAPTLAPAAAPASTVTHAGEAGSAQPGAADPKDTTA
jgi:capsular exopolysaccharide synthesis family protein